MPNYAPRVSLSYNDMSGVIHVWAKSCTQMAVYQHSPDQGCTKTHVHMIMLGCTYKTCETLKKQFYKLTGSELDGNELWEWTHKEWEGQPDLSFITYMSKGELRPVFVKDITDEEIEELRKKWVSHPKGVESSQIQTRIKTKEPKKLTKYDICVEVMSSIKEHNPGLATENISDELWFRAIRKVLIAHRQPLGLYKVVDIYDACIMYNDKNKFLSNCLQILEKRKPRI